VLRSRFTPAPHKKGSLDLFCDSAAPAPNYSFDKSSPRRGAVRSTVPPTLLRSSPAVQFLFAVAAKGCNACPNFVEVPLALQNLGEAPRPPYGTFGFMQSVVGAGEASSPGSGTRGAPNEIGARVTADSVRGWSGSETARPSILSYSSLKSLLIPDPNSLSTQSSSLRSYSRMLLSL
jgi:hypothetical protein